MTGGGIQAMVAGLTNEMVKNNDVTLLLIYKPDEKDIFLNKLDKRIKVISLGKTKPGFSIKHIFKIASFVRKNSFDIVHFHGFFHYHFLSVILNHTRTKIFYTVHNDADRENTYWEKKMLPLKRYCFQKGWMMAVTISNTSQKSFVQLYNSPNILIYNGIGRFSSSSSGSDSYIPSLHLAANTKILLHPGRITKQKNQVMLCRAVSSLQKEGLDIILLMAGGQQDEGIFAELKRYFEEGRIIYLGERKDIPQLMRNADGLCLSSLWEGLPVVLLESFAAGCIPICTPVGGIPDIVQDNFNGILSESTSEEDYKSALRRWYYLTDDERTEIRTNVLKSFDRYDISNCANEYINAYTKALNK